MKILISEKQFKKLVDNVSETELDEQDNTVTDATPKTGASSYQSGGQGYPDVSKWTDVVGSKLTRGPANQIKNTKWSETVGSTLKRDAANQIN